MVPNKEKHIRVEKQRFDSASATLRVAFFFNAPTHLLVLLQVSTIGQVQVPRAFVAPGLMLMISLYSIKVSWNKLEAASDIWRATFAVIIMILIKKIPWIVGLTTGKTFHDGFSMNSIGGKATFQRLNSALQLEIVVTF